MRTASLRSFGAALVLSVLFNGAVTESQAQYSRRNAIVEAVQKTRPSIVAIKAEKSNRGGKGTTGTGVIVDERGYIITSRHVVVAADRVMVQLVDGSELSAKVVVEESRYDLAILQVHAGKTLPYLTLGPGSDLMVGETIIAVGHPYGYKNTVSTGIISAVDREIEMPTGDVLTNLIQTNASINPGNSGGPILNVNGELIGITAAMRDGAQGIAFALNADTVKQFLCKHLNARKVSGLSHGLNCQEQVAEEGQQRQKVLVKEVAEQSPAAEAGLKTGDAILRVAEQPVSNRFDVERAFWDRKAGDKVVLTVLRQGKEVTVDMTLSTGAAAQRVVAQRVETTQPGKTAKAVDPSGVGIDEILKSQRK